ncbi:MULTISPECIES: ATP-binding cassette domain-containing protein [unclassified Bartonella]|uniref:ATP-binding cassette domain-containing protein n=1 Tax=unclassified Bartonella TaxID=2645622 RepID=UPI00099ACBD1|nr:MULTISPECIES: ATP-binding cassette domain-containing protein [unclassified Bartonella]
MVVFTFIGENGAEKSTLMRLISEIYQPDFFNNSRGQMLLKGKEFKLSSPKEAIEMGVAIIH